MYARKLLDSVHEKRDVCGSDEGEEVDWIGGEGEIKLLLDESDENGIPKCLREWREKGKVGGG